MSQTTNAGIVTAYGAAVRGGYEGTYDQFCADLAQLATVLAQLTNMSAVAETLAAGSSATASYEDGVLTLGIPRGDTGNGIQSISLISTVGLVKTYRITFTDEDHFDFEVKDGNGIASATLNQDYTLTLTFNDGTTWTSTSIRGATGATPNLTIGTVSTGAPGSSAEAEITGTPEDPVLNLTLPQGAPGEVPAAAIASTQASTTASKKILEGEYFWLSGILYIATAEIASGGTIVTSGSGANCKTAKVADDVGELKTAINDTILSIDEGNTPYFVEWESGVISSEDGTDVNPPVNTRARTVGYLSTDVNIAVDRDTVQYGTYLYYYDNNKAFQLRSDQIIDTNIVPSKLYAYYRVAVLNRTNTSLVIDVDQTDADFVFSKQLDFLKDVNAEYLNTAVGELDTEVGITFEMTEDDAILKLRKLPSSSTLTEDANGTRLRIIFDCRNVVPINALISCSFGPIYVGEWSSISLAVNSDPNSGGIKMLTSEYVTSPVSGTIESDGFLGVSIKKADNSAFTDAEKDAALAAISISLTCKSTATRLDTIESDIGELASGIKELYFGELINGRLTESGTDTTSEYAPYRLSTHEVVAFPTNARKFTVRIADNYLVAMRTGVAANNLNHNLYWFADGDVITVPDGDNYYGISVCRAYGPTVYIDVKIYPTDAEKIRLSLCYNAFPESGNPDAEKVLNAARLTFNTTEPNNLSAIPLIAHASDCHGDYQRVKNFLNFCDKVGVSAACITGDITAYTPAQGLSWFSALVNNTKSLCGVCIGNHDVYDNAMTDEQAYAFVFDAIATKIGNNTGKTYYYTDIVASKIRLISVNLYEYGGTTRNYTHFTDAQLAWLCDTLSSTPEGYGVILLYHSPQVNVSTAQSAEYSTFFQSVRKYNNIYSGVTGSPINDIIDAFIGRTTLAQTYTQTGNPSSVSVSADFSSVDNTVEFIAHLTGHFHQDTVCYVPGTTAKQLMLNVVCTNSLYGGTVYPYLCDLTDLPRNISDATHDSFNVYAIDRANKTVKVIRVGSDMTYEMQPRKYMVIPYAD